MLGTGPSAGEYTVGGRASQPPGTVHRVGHQLRGLVVGPPHVTDPAVSAAPLSWVISAKTHSGDGPKLQDRLRQLPVRRVVERGQLCLTSVISSLATTGDIGQRTHVPMSGRFMTQSCWRPVRFESDVPVWATSSAAGWPRIWSCSTPFTDPETRPTSAVSILRCRSTAGGGSVNSTHGSTRAAGGSAVSATPTVGCPSSTRARFDRRPSMALADVRAAARASDQPRWRPVGPAGVLRLDWEDTRLAAERMGRAAKEFCGWPLAYRPETPGSHRWAWSAGTDWPRRP